MVGGWLNRSNQPLVSGRPVSVRLKHTERVRSSHSGAPGTDQSASVHHAADATRMNRSPRAAKDPSCRSPDLPHGREELPVRVVWGCSYYFLFGPEDGSVLDRSAIDVSSKKVLTASDTCFHREWAAQGSSSEH